MVADRRAPKIAHRLEIAGALTRQEVEALELEIRRLAKQSGVEIAELRIEQIDDGAPADS